MNCSPSRAIPAAFFLVLTMTALLMASACGNSAAVQTSTNHTVSTTSTALSTTNTGPGRTTTQTATPAASTVVDVTTKEAWDMVQAHRGQPDFVVVDVRTPDEYNSGHIEGAINIDYLAQTFKADVSAMNMNRTYLVYCRSGTRSRSATTTMAGLGFEHVYNMLGGFTEWQKEGFPAVTQ